MPETNGALTIVIFLLPGFLTQRLVDALTVRHAVSDTALIVEALMFALIDYFLYGLLAVLGALPPLSNLVMAGGAMVASLSAVIGLAVLVAGAVVLGLGWSFIANRGWFYAFSRWIGITTKTGAVGAWLDTFEAFRGAWVRVHLQSGVEIVGWPKFYSEGSNPQEIFLAESYFERPDGTVFNVDGPGILIPANAAIEMIELLK
ncbi:MAG TPA: DUF6338 family protein [Candidatus Binataceae bacterium]|nr:DUF6338 family protein [Candidatus Binataceae bacterium]